MSPFINTYSEDRSHERAHNRERDIQMVNVIKKTLQSVHVLPIQKRGYSPYDPSYIKSNLHLNHSHTYLVNSSMKNEMC